MKILFIRTIPPALLQETTYCCFKLPCDFLKSFMKYISVKIYCKTIEDMKYLTQLVGEQISRDLLVGTTDLHCFLSYDEKTKQFIFLWPTEL